MGVFWPNTVNSLRPAFFTSCAAVRSIRNNLAVPAVKMGNAFRRQPEPALYGENKTPVSEDLLEVGLLVAFGLIGFSFILIIPGIRGWERLWATVRVFVALWIGAVLLVCNFGYGWYTNTITTETQYKPYTAMEIHAEVGLHIGLRGVNITLLGVPEMQYGEQINYNEQFWWADPWAQGRIGFGRYAGRFNREFRAAQFRGVPYPIQWIAEYFTLDGEQIRWGRKFRLAGWYGHIFMWLGFAVYLVAAILATFTVRYTAIALLWLSIMMIMAVFWYGVIIINDPPLAIPFPSGFLTPQFGWSWGLTCATGIGTFFLSLFLLVLDYFFPRTTAQVFNLHRIAEDDIFYQETTPEAKEDEFGVSDVRASNRRRGGTVSRFRQTQRKSRKTTRSTRGHEEVSGDIALSEVKS